MGKGGPHMHYVAPHIKSIYISPSLSIKQHTWAGGVGNGGYTINGETRTHVYNSYTCMPYAHICRKGNNSKVESNKQNFSLSDGGYTRSKGTSNLLQCANVN